MDYICPYILKRSIKLIYLLFKTDLSCQRRLQTLSMWHERVTRNITTYRSKFWQLLPKLLLRSLTLRLCTTVMRQLFKRRMRLTCKVLLMQIQSR